MKKLLSTIAAVLCGTFILNASSLTMSDDEPTPPVPPTPKDGDVRKGGNTKNNERSEPSDVFVKVFSNTVFVDLFETGPATVFLVDSFGQVVSSVVSEGFEYESLSLPLPSSKGSYTLVVWGTYYYGEWHIID